MTTNPMQKYIALGVSAMLILLIGGVSAIISFLYIGFIPAFIILLFTVAGGLAIIMKFLIKDIPPNSFMERIENENGTVTRQIIIRDPKNKNFIYFNETGELLRTQFGTFFFYGHPFKSPKKVLIINSLNSKEADYPIITISGRLEYHANELYVETSHPLISKNSPLSYEDIKMRISSDDLLQNLNDYVRQVFMINPKNLDKKTKPSDISELLPDNS